MFDNYDFNVFILLVCFIFINLDIIYYVQYTKEMIFLQNNNRRDFSKSNGLRNGSKTQGQYGKSSFNTTIEQPKINESGMEAKKRGF